MKTYIGLDIGGTKIEGILWGGGKVLNAQKIKTPKNRKQFLIAMVKLIQDLKDDLKIQGIGISCAGAIEDKTGKIINSPNMKFLNGLRLANALAKKFRVKARIKNDTNCFLIGEGRFGAAKGRKNVVALTLGTGVGGAVLIDGRLLYGAHGAAGELGHMVIASQNSSPNPLFNQRGGEGGIQEGRRGELFYLTLEALASSHFFKKFNLGGALEVQRKAEDGNKKAQKIYRDLGEYLGAGLASLNNIFDPELIVLGGGISRGYRLFLPQSLKIMKKYSMLPPNYLPPVKISKLKNVGALGAVSLFFSK